MVAVIYERILVFYFKCGIISHREASCVAKSHSLMDGVVNQVPLVPGDQKINSQSSSHGGVGEGGTSSSVIPPMNPVSIGSLQGRRSFWCLDTPT